MGSCFRSSIPWSHKWKCQSTKESELQIATISSAGVSVIGNPMHEMSPTEANGKFQRLQTRYVFTMLSFLGFFNCFTMRFNLNVTLMAMVKSPLPSDRLSSIDETSQVCVKVIDSNKIKNSTLLIQEGEFDWDSKLQHLALAAFFFGYVAIQIPSGILAEKYYAKHFFGIGILISSLFTLLTPIAARHSIEALIAVRVIQGLGQAPTWPAMNTLIGRWVPIMERSRATGIINTGCIIGVVVSFAMSGMLCESTIFGGWPSVFYFFGTIGCVWCVFWNFLVFESPEDHPYITKEELMYIREGQQEMNGKQAVPWKSILTSFPVWGLLIVHFGQDWGNYTLLNETPIYLNNVLHFDLKSNGFLSALPNIISAVIAVLVSVLADKLRQKGLFGITTIRKIVNSIEYFTQLGNRVYHSFLRFRRYRYHLQHILLRRPARMANSSQRSKSSKRRKNRKRPIRQLITPFLTTYF